jgi:RNA polymerase sigma-70 factor, ECF subfamily
MPSNAIAGLSLFHYETPSLFACIRHASIAGFSSMSIAPTYGLSLVRWSRMHEFLPAVRSAIDRVVKTEPLQETPDDDELLRRMGTGDAGALAGFYDRHSTLLFSIALKVLGDSREAEEVLQDAMRLVWERAPLFQPALGRPLSWAMVITRNKAIDRLRALRRASEAAARIAKEFAPCANAAPGAPLDEGAGPLLRSALGGLPSEQRAAIELAYFTGMSHTEIAVQLGQPLGTIKARIRRGMTAMRDVLEEQL